MRAVTLAANVQVLWEDFPTLRIREGQNDSRDYKLSEKQLLSLALDALNTYGFVVKGIKIDD